MPPPPPPPPPTPPANPLLNTKTTTTTPHPPPHLPARPPNTTLVSLLIYNGHPFADHWEYFVASPTHPDGTRGTVIQAAGDVRSGFWLEVKRGWDSETGVHGDGRGVWKRVGLGWVGLGYFEEGDSGVGGDRGDEDTDGDEGSVGKVRGVFEGGKGGEAVVEDMAKCEFERMLFKVPAPKKTLRTVDGAGQDGNKREKITQRNCQTWVVESAELLVREGIFEQGVVNYLRTTSIMTPP